MNKQYTYVALAVIIFSSGFVHIFNPVGFPDIFFDEGIYMRRAMHVLSGQGPQESNFHDHPLFGQILLGSVLFITGFPNSLNPTTDAQSLQSLYLIPRVFVGMLAVLDTFLVYKITQKRYNPTVALVAAGLFAVMPYTWILRRILLDSLLLPFLLSSILVALHARDSKNRAPIVLLSGILLGIAIFTKAPVFCLIPFIAGIIFWHSGKSWKMLGLWLVPVMLIPLIWPVQAMADGQFDQWINDVVWQTQRQSSGIDYIAKIFFEIDPILFVLGICGFVFAAIRKDYFVISWSVSFAMFLFLIGYSQYFHWIPMFPAFCIAAACLIHYLPQRIKQNRMRRIAPPGIAMAVCIIGFVCTSMLIPIDVSSAEFEAASYVLNNLDDSDTTTLAGPTYSWIFSDVFDKKNVPIDYSVILFGSIHTQKVLLVSDPHFLIDIKRGPQLAKVYNETKTVATFEGNVLDYDTAKYPLNSLNLNYEGSRIEIKKSAWG